MTGFGSGPFGSEAFGDGNWSKRVLFDLAPDLYRDQDQLTGGLFELFTQGIRPSFDFLKQKIRNFDDLRDPLRVRTQYNEVYKFKLGKQVIDSGTLLQRGIDGTVSALGEFQANSARLSSVDIGKIINISRSLIPGNNKSVTIVGVINKTTAIVTPSLSATISIFRWELRNKNIVNTKTPTYEIRSGDVTVLGSGWEFHDGFSVSTLLTRNVFSNELTGTSPATEREGADGIIDSSGRIKSASIKLTQQDVGKMITISGSSIDKNNGKFEIIAVDEISPTDKRAVFSRLFIRGADVDGGIIYTGTPLVSGITVTQVKTGVFTPLTVVVTDNSIVVNLETDISGDVSSSANDVVSAIEASIDASALVSVIATGTGAGLAKEHVISDVFNGILEEDPGTLIWAILPFSRIMLNSSVTPKGMIEQDGLDLSISSSVITIPSGSVTSADIGKQITIRGSSTSTNNSVFQIVSVPTFNTLTVDSDIIDDAGPLCWDIKSSTVYGDLTQVQINAPSLIVHFARDFDLEIDQSQTEIRQRSLLSTFNQWIDKKGHSSAYEALGKISGYDVSVQSLFRIDRNLAISGLGFSVIEIDDSGTGHAGTQGSILYLPTGGFTFSDPTAVFTNADVDKVLNISGADTGSNNTLFTIGGFVDSNTVKLVQYEQPLADNNNGDLVWNVARVYTDQVPTLPNFDEINTDLLTELVGTPTDYPEFTIDKFCFESDMVDYVSITIDNNPSNTKFLYTNRVQITFQGDPFSGINLEAPLVVVSIGNWYIEDDDGTRFYLETMPVETSPGSHIYTIEAIETVLPVTGGLLKYDCPINLLCIYCPASKIYLTIEATDILNDPAISQENALNRLLARFKEVTPIHVGIEYQVI